MKKGLLATTALAGAGILAAGAASAAEAPEYKLSGSMNFQFYWIDADFTLRTADGWLTTDINNAATIQDHGWYFGVDEAELQLDVSGVADNGLKYGFKIEIQVDTSDDKVADEARIQLSGNWGTLQLGDEDGAEDIMNYGGENLMGAASGFDGGDYEDIVLFNTHTTGPMAPTRPNIEGDTGDHTKISYFSPRFSGFQIGGSITPQPDLDGDEFKQDGDWENHYGLGANYDNSFGDFRVRVSAVYSAASSNDTSVEDISAWSVGAILGFGAFSIGGNYTDNGDSGTTVGSGDESSYWNVAGQFSTGPFTIGVGYFEGTYDFGGGSLDDEFTNIAVTADYTVAPGFGVYADLTLIEDDDADEVNDQEATTLILGAKVSF